MTNNNVDRLLSILEKYEINLDITEEELSLLPDNIIDRLEYENSKYTIISILSEEISYLRDRIHSEKLRQEGFLNDWEKENFPAIFETFIK